MSKYTEIKDEQHELVECFFAFSNEQLAEGIKNTGIQGQKIYSGGYGLYGTEKGILDLRAKMDSRSERIAKECDPQEVYDYEFWNHECGYTCDDTEPIKIVLGYFGLEKAKEVKRKFKACELEELVNERD